VIVDFCAYLGHWPLYQLPISNATGLLQVMDRCGISAAWVSLVDGPFLLNPQEANERLSDLVAQHLDRLYPVGTINVNLSGWCDDVLDGIQRLKLAGFRLYPTYHDYALDSEEVIALATMLTEYQRPLFVAAFIDEERFQHPAIRVPPISLASMANLVHHVPQTTLVLNNLKVEEAMTLLERPDLLLDNVFLDVNAMDMPFNGLAQLIECHGSDHLVYGSQIPFLYPEATLALVQESGVPQSATDAILGQNWRTNDTFRRLIGSIAY
jgi:predicted TIM-barrel fold metal-dependent hydrolase